MYKILGSDGHEYGPLSIEKVKQWIAENRVEKKTPVLPDGAADWVFLSSMPEFTEAFAAQEKTGGAAPGKQRRGIYIGLLVLAAIVAAVLGFLKYAKPH
jgi:hypothetical protein